MNEIPLHESDPSPAIARIEDFEVGQHVSFSKTFTEDDVKRFIEITGDVNPLHVDEEFARRRSSAIASFGNADGVDLAVDADSRRADSRGRLSSTTSYRRSVELENGLA